MFRLRLYEKRPILHAIIWLFVYIVIAYAGNYLPQITSVDNLANGILLLVLSVVLFFYIRKNNLLSYYGFTKLKYENAKRADFYLPFLLLIILNGITGINRELGTAQILSIFLNMACVGFLEEVIFRGFLYKSILAKVNVKKAIFISGIAFGMLHIINIFQGCSGAELIMQVSGAVVIGIMLTVIVEITGNILPGIVFHFLFDAVSFISKGTTTHMGTMIYLIAMNIITIIYTIHLFTFVGNDKTEVVYKHNI